MTHHRQHIFGTVLMLMIGAAGLAVATCACHTRMDRHIWIAAQDSDTDKDGIPDLFDLCPGKDNIGSPDRDHDGIKDSCDLSPTGDGTLHVTYGSRTYIMDGDSAASITVALADR